MYVASVCVDLAEGQTIHALIAYSRQSKTVIIKRVTYKEGNCLKCQDTYAYLGD